MKVKMLDIYTPLYKNSSHRDWLSRVALVFREHIGVTENGMELHEQGKRLSETKRV